MTLTPYKTIIQVVALERDEQGNIVGERSSEPLVLYGIEPLKEWVEGYEREHFPSNGQVIIPEIALPDKERA